MPLPVDPKDDPATQSEDYKAMLPEWETIGDILAGERRIKELGVRYLPRYSKEGDSAYSSRLAATPWRPEFVDALRGICAKPFTKEVVVNADAPDLVQGDLVGEKREGGLVDDIDGQGNSLHVFARDVFWNGVAKGLDAIYVAYPDAEAKTRAEEKQIGARPYWVHVRAQNILQLLWRKVGGRLIPSHVRIRECSVEQNGFSEVEVERIRVLELDDANQPGWRLFKKEDGQDNTYQLESEGRLQGVSEIPLALFFTGERTGNYRVRPPMADLAAMQLELYRALSRKDRILTLAGSPMLVGSGMRPPEPTPVYDTKGKQTGERPAPQLEVGPGTVLFAPPAAEGVQSSWSYIQPDAANITEVRSDIDGIMEDFRRLALQPSTPKSGNLVATGQAIDAAKSHSAIEVWANGLADALNQALYFTAQWLGIADTVTAVVNTDFSVELQAGTEAQWLGSMQQRKVISAQTEREEAARRRVLGPQFDEDEEVERIAGETMGLDGEQAIDPVTGQPVRRPTLVDQQQ